MTIENSKRVKAMIKRHEGLRLSAYLDTEGKFTIGYGHLMRAREPRVIDADTAEELFESDFLEALTGAAKLVSNYEKLTDARKAALIDMVFNLGYAGAKKFAKTMALIEAEKYKEAAREMLSSKWALQVKKRAIELSQIMETGEFVTKEKGW